VIFLKSYFSLILLCYFSSNNGLGCMRSTSKKKGQVFTLSFVDNLQGKYQVQTHKFKIKILEQIYAKNDRSSIVKSSEYLIFI
jgi:hypothetical protein